MEKSKRAFLKYALGSVIIVGTGGLSSQKAVASPAKISLDDAQAKSLKYVHSSKIEGRNCANCALIQGSDGDEWRPCAIFPGKLVSAEGWCSAWVAKP
ncbi:high-potential iron-sulfur protein [Thaumasiovibrio subtropicus]|nr:high-potential iron-sulfur protein [Thaumasiovibrio subtropicus]